MPYQFSPSLVTPVDSASSVRQFDVIVIGGGIAGLAFALRLPRQYSIALLTKGVLGESNTRYAQGGLAAAIGPTDNPDLHYADTIASGAGHCDSGAVRALVDGAPGAVAWLLAQGTRFDFDNDQLALGLEAAHSRNRVLHAGGDATGAEIENSLVQQIHKLPQITLFEHATAIDLVRAGPADGAAIVGATVLLAGETSPTLFNSCLTALANGGAGQIWAVTSNPAGATGDGIAMAIRAGIDVADLEFTQFHPTVFTAQGIEPFLMTEAIRGEGGWLRSADGTRFMVDHHPLAELAPRDVVARAVQSQMAIDGANSVSLDLRHLDPDLVRHRFPTILRHLGKYGIDLMSDLIPVAPAAHYFIGGIVADSSGKTSAKGLLAIGEVSCTGVHGANRLASNSLLEGLVFGLRAADLISVSGLPESVTIPPSTTSPIESHPIIHDGESLAKMQRLMSNEVAVVRSAQSLGRAAHWLAAAAQTSIDPSSTSGIERRNALLHSCCIVDAAEERRESRGSHFRSDFPDPDPSLANAHQIVLLKNDNRDFGPLGSGRSTSSSFSR